MVTALGISQDLPHTSQSKSWCGDGQIYCWRWPVHMLDLRFQIGVGSIIENTQIVFISESLNDFTPGVNIMTTPHVFVYIEVTCDKYLASYVSDQVWQISGVEVVVARDVDRKDSDRCITQSHLDCYGLEVRVDLNHLVVESLLYVDQDSSTWQLIWIPPQRFAVAVIVGTSVVTQGWRVLQFCFLQANDIRLMLAYQDIKIPSVTSQTSGIPLQNCGSHYDFVCLAAWPFLWLRSGAAFVNGDITGTKVGPFLLNSNFRWGVGDWLGMYEGESRGPSILLVWAGDMLARGPAVPADCLWGHVGLRDRGFVGLSHRGVVGTSHRCGVLDTD